jgi:hypothetical protein
MITRVKNVVLYFSFLSIAGNFEFINSLGMLNKKILDFMGARTCITKILCKKKELFFHTTLTKDQFFIM